MLSKMMTPQSSRAARRNGVGGARRGHGHEQPLLANAGGAEDGEGERVFGLF